MLSSAPEGTMLTSDLHPEFFSQLLPSSDSDSYGMPGCISRATLNFCYFNVSIALGKAMHMFLGVFLNYYIDMDDSIAKLKGLGNMNRCKYNCNKEVLFNLSPLRYCKDYLKRRF